MIARLFWYEIVVASVVGGISGVGGFLLLAGVVPAPSQPPVWAVTCVLVPMFLWSIVLRVVGKGQLAFPISVALRGKVVAVIIVTFVALVIYGVSRWPAAPITPRDAGYVDKLGRTHSLESFRAFRRWETTYFCLGLPFALAAITSIPAEKTLRPNKKMQLTSPG
jgi:hypothetical protein